MTVQYSVIPTSSFTLIIVSNLTNCAVTGREQKPCGFQQTIFCTVWHLLRLTVDCHDDYHDILKLKGCFLKVRNEGQRSDIQNLAQLIRPLCCKINPNVIILSNSVTRSKCLSNPSCKQTKMVDIFVTAA